MPEIEPGLVIWGQVPCLLEYFSDPERAFLLEKSDNFTKVTELVKLEMQD